jgi:hypothetical protein
LQFSRVKPWTPSQLHRNQPFNATNPTKTPIHRHRETVSRPLTH